MSGRHAPNSWDSYLSAHHGRLADFTDHFVERDTLEIKTAETIVLWSGIPYCRDGIEIQVEKRQRAWLRSGRRWVETIGYSYHVMIRAGDGVRGLFRYDNSHPHPSSPSRRPAATAAPVLLIHLISRVSFCSAFGQINFY